MTTPQRERKMTLRPLFLTDLDDTLFTTARKISTVPIEKCTVASTLVDGSASGYRTPQHQALATLMAGGDVIPVTARGRDVLARCDVSQAPAICSNGGVIVTADGIVDAEWHNRIAGEVGDGHEINAIHDEISRLAGDGFRHWTVDESDTPLYICFKSNASDEDAVAQLALEVEGAALLPEGWKIHCNGNNLAIMPAWISKRSAVKHVVERIRREAPHRLVIGVGDSLSDLGFMAECDYAMHPTRSQIGDTVARLHSW